MGYFLLLLSISLVAVGTWNWVRVVKAADAAGRRRYMYLWATVTLLGITLFFLLKIFTDSS